MKILKIAPIYVPLSPKKLKYGGIERVVLGLARSFTEKGHQVHIACPGDSELSNKESVNYGNILETLDKSEWSKPKFSQDPDAYEKHVKRTIEYLDTLRPDIVHDHTGNFVLSETFNDAVESNSLLREIPIIVTPHEFQRFKKVRPPKIGNIIFTALSEYQKKVFSDYVSIEEVINNGVFVEEFPFSAEKKDFLFSLGSIEEAKGQDLAVRVALEIGLPLTIAGPIANNRFYDLEIRHYVKEGKVKYAGSLDDKQKKDYLVNALASISPIRIGDCFSLVRIEPLACGTPVITLDTGSAREAIVDNPNEPEKRTGFLINPSDENIAVEKIVEAVRNIQNKAINPYVCRKDVEKRFNWRAISDKYISLYQRIRDKLYS